MTLVTAVKPLQVRGRFLTAVVLPVTGSPDAAFYAALDALLQQSPGFFAEAPVILDVARARGLDAKEDFTRLLDNLRHRKISPIAVQKATSKQKSAAAEAGLTTLQVGQESPLERKSRPVTAAPQPPEPGPGTLLITTPVRSGQRIVAERGDLVVVAPVSSGAELIAHGSVHVYGSLRGRALAGVHGDREARIFCQSLEAELIAIAGLYMTSENLGPAVTKQRVQAFLEDDALRVEPLK